jgi:ComEC/Rec2-related protein
MKAWAPTNNRRFGKSIRKEIIQTVAKGLLRRAFCFMIRLLSKENLLMSPTTTDNPSTPLRADRPARDTLSPDTVSETPATALSASLVPPWEDPPLPEDELYSDTLEPPSSDFQRQATSGASRPSGEKRLQKYAEPSHKPLFKRYEAFLVPVFVLFVLGNALSYALPALPFSHLAIGVPLSLMLLGLAIYGVQHPEKRWVFRNALWVIAFLIGCLYYPQGKFQPPPNNIGNFAPRDYAEVRGIVTQSPVDHKLIILAKKLDGKPVSGQILAYVPYNSADDDIQAGTRILIRGNLERPFHSAVPGAFNQESYLANQGITAVLKRPERLVGFETSNEWPYTLQRYTDALKQQVSKTFSQALPSPQAEVFGGLVLGDKAIPIDPKTKQNFIQTGMVHLLAASGMNVGIIAAAVFWLLALLKVPYRTRLLVAIGAVGIYSLMTGLPPSIQRASAMLELALCLKLLNRQLSSVFLLCLASALLIAIHPDNVANIGFQFSVLTTFGLITMVTPLQEAIGYYTTRWLAGLVLIPAIAQLWIWPLSVAYFNQFPIHTIPLNILALALVTPLTVLGFAAALASLVFPPLAGLLAAIAHPLLDALLALAQWGNDMTWARWTLPSPSGWQILLIYGFLFLSLALIYRMKSWPLPRKALIGLLPIVLLLAGMALERLQAHNQAHIELLPLSPTHEAYIIKPIGAEDRIAILPAHLSYSESRTLGDYFRHQHLSELRAVILLPDLQPSLPSEAAAPEGTPAQHLPEGRFSDLLQPIRFQPTRLQNAFKGTHTRLLLSPNPNQHALESISADERQAFPAPGLRLTLGNFTVEGHMQALRLMSQQYCLVAIDQPPAMAAESPSTGIESSIPGCSLHVVSQDSTQIFANRPLPANRYYKLIQEGEQLSIFEQ